MGVIKKLDPIISNKIAAGEVIEKLANVVKELVENAIDAKAKKIDIDLVESGLKLIRVIDDGVGMDSDDIEAAFLRHATSKIFNVNDLFRIQSLGFRGEALPSIASIAKVTISSNRDNQAKMVVYDNGKFIKKIDTSFNKGTKVEVEKIFHYTPARFKYLKSENYELAMIQNLVYQFALAYPNISFRLTNNSKGLFSSRGNGDILNLMAQIYGANVGKALIKFSGKTRDYEISGYTSKPVINRSNKNYIQIIVNHRVIQDSQIIRAILESYDQLIPKQRYPITVIYIDVDPILIDVNVHPRKQEIKFSEKKALLELIKTTIEKQVSAKPIYQEVEKNFSQTALSFSENNTDNYNEDKSEEDILAKKDKSISPKTKDKVIIPDIEYIGQYSGTYLIFQNQAGLFLVDQHAAAERIRYEKYIVAMNKNNPEIRSTLVPLRLDFPQDVISQAKNFKQEIFALGIKLKFYKSYILVNEIPQWFPENYEEIYLESIIYNFIEGKSNKKQDLIDDLAKLLACKHSLKANHYITEKEANHLINDLRMCKRPYTCPHGRPIIVKIKVQEIEHWFNRVI
ncbi:MAG: DNA mismatch repair endonuclease MutL [Candidatus Izemoplasmatales bacterium]